LEGEREPARQSTTAKIGELRELITVVYRLSDSCANVSSASVRRHYDVNFAIPPIADLSLFIMQALQNSVGILRRFWGTALQIVGLPFSLAVVQFEFWRQYGKMCATELIIGLKCIVGLLNYYFALLSLSPRKGERRRKKGRGKKERRKGGQMRMGQDRRVEILNKSLIVVLNMFVGPENGSPTVPTLFG